MSVTKTPPRISSGEKGEGETTKGKRTRGKDGEKGGVNDKNHAEFMEKMMITQGVSEPIFCDYDSFHLKIRISNQFVPLLNRMIKILNRQGETEYRT